MSDKPAEWHIQRGERALYDIGDTTNAAELRTARLEVAAQRQRIEALEAALGALVVSPMLDEPSYIERRGRDMCLCTYCDNGWLYTEPEQHYADCPVTTARALLEGNETNGGMSHE